MQLDEAERGFSLRFDAPLDMRMESAGRSAADILRDEDEETIADILFHFGEERAARRIARAIVADRKAAPFVSTLQLAGHDRPGRARPGAGNSPIRRPGPFRPCASPSTTNSASSCADWSPPNGS